MNEEMNTAGGSSASKTNTGLIIGLIVVVIAVAAFAFMRDKDSQNMSGNDSNMMMEDNTDSMNRDMMDDNSMDAMDQGSMNKENNMTEEGNETNSANTMEVGENGEKKFTLTAENFKFSQSEIRVKKGDKVEIMLDNKQGMHDLVIDEFNVRTEILDGVGTDDISFTADKAGEFEFYCSVGEHRQMGMKGKLIIEE